jgi:hypothetical protein
MPNFQAPPRSLFGCFWSRVRLPPRTRVAHEMMTLTYRYVPVKARVKNDT